MTQSKNEITDSNKLCGFPEALRAAIDSTDVRIAREGWNGKNLYVFKVVHTNGLEPHLVIRNGLTGKMNTWVPSSSDLQENDWYVIGE